MLSWSVLSPASQRDLAFQGRDRSQATNFRRVATTECFFQSSLRDE